MSKVSITRSLLDDLAMSISAKSGEAVPMTLTEMKDAVDGIQTGGSPTLQTITKSYTPTESQQTETITAGSGYDGIEEVDVTVGAISSTYVGSGITQRSSSDLTASGATVTVPSGYYSAQASKAVASGTAGTPTATKGTVSNHSISVTPSVTNTTGYISGGAKTGTAVTVSASELVSGSETKTENGTYDVTNLASLVVNVSGGTSVQTKTGTFTGSNGVSVDISCNFAPDLIYVYGNLSGSTSNRGVISITIVKDTMILQTSDTSSSSANESAPYFASSGVSGYVGNSSYCHATYSNSTLTIATGSNTSANRFTSGITYSYKLLKWTA